jgi:hypothetical protein
MTLGVSMPSQDLETILPQAAGQAIFRDEGYSHKILEALHAGICIATLMAASSSTIELLLSFGADTQSWASLNGAIAKRPKDD